MPTVKPTFFLVTVRKTGTEKYQQRRIAAISETEAGKKTCELIGGTNAGQYKVVSCKRENNLSRSVL